MKSDQTNHKSALREPFLAGTQTPEPAAERANSFEFPDPGSALRPDPGASARRPASDLEDGIFAQLKSVCEYLEGCSTRLPAGWAFLASPWIRGLWWGILAGAILLFCGQTSKFIYIDF